MINLLQCDIAGLKVSKTGPRYPILHFADDTLILVSGILSQSQRVKDTLI